MKTPLLSVIIPVYNAERYIETTIRSVLTQTVSDLELIVLNDGSKDGSAAIIERLAQEDARIHFINKENTGVSDTRNRGIAVAKGKYFAFLDADDVWKPQNLERKLKVLEETGSKWVFCKLEFIDENGALMDMKPVNFKPYDIVKNLLLWEGDVVPGPCSNIVVRRELFDEGVRFDTKLSSPADRDICIQLARKAEPVYLDEILWQYRQHSMSMTSVNVKVVDEVLEFIKKAKREKWFPDAATKRKSLSNIYLILAGIALKFTGHKWQGIKMLMKACYYSPANVWNKKIASKFRQPK